MYFTLWFDVRYLASTGKDGYLFFWQWLSDSQTFRYAYIIIIIQT